MARLVIDAPHSATGYGEVDEHVILPSTRDFVSVDMREILHLLQLFNRILIFSILDSDPGPALDSDADPTLDSVLYRILKNNLLLCEIHFVPFSNLNVKENERDDSDKPHVAVFLRLSKNKILPGEYWKISKSVYSLLDKYLSEYSKMGYFFTEKIVA
ncbi:hypothetical protein EVAR_90684_1 [Eumeta japonica]|uniref:Uncharacterized protein n=1 Tax=Eumeta variegata TaxID=151549 RepID=A0A4C1Z0Y7_EUMVA|nr:hypothetical protein EVAR_90684_1 [Eumeta japonica]